jgi:hypothetical protein
VGNVKLRTEAKVMMVVSIIILYYTVVRFLLLSGKILTDVARSYMTHAAEKIKTFSTTPAWLAVLWAAGSYGGRRYYVSVRRSTHSPKSLHRQYDQTSLHKLKILP